ncbi:protein transport protein BET1 [Flagelloscypha sp. PMI_526]|nr:protein transport protein BET1 [Flagelloscypha sp. PMI_526]
MSHRVRQTGGSLHNRASLLPTSNPPSGRSSPYYSDASSEPNGHRFADDLEGQNDEALEGLSAKVKLLKDITSGIGNEIRDSTVQLSQMNDAFSETGDILSGTFRRMNNMAQRQGCRWLWYIVFLVIVFWFFLIVWWFRR